MKSKISLIYSFILLLTASSSVFAGTESGLYIGAGVGDASVAAGVFDESATSSKIFGGYNFGIIPLVDLAVEASYNDFGNASSAGSNVEITGISAFGLAGLSFGPFGAFVKAGAMEWDLDTNPGSNDSGSNPAYGIGVRFALSSLAIRAEYEVYDLDNVDLEMLSVSAMYTF